MRHRQGRRAKWIFSVMVPLTVVGFLLGVLTLGDTISVVDFNDFQVFDGVLFSVFICLLSLDCSSQL
jgi:hypothetical protein